MYNYKCLNPISQTGLSLFDDNYTPVEDITEADAVLVRSASMHDLETGDKLLAVARAGAGVNNIPTDLYAKEGIVVFNTPGANANGVKELVIAGMLMASRDLIGGNRWVAENKDDPQITKSMEKAKKSFAGNEISEKKLGVIGLGAIGVLVANAGVDLGMTVTGFDPYLPIKSAWNMNPAVKQAKNADEIYETCDFISIHVPLLDSTRNMIGSDAMNRMKNSAVIMNFARNGLVDEDALVSALDEKKIGAYVTDFPTPKVAGRTGVIAFPHLGASTDESEENCARMAVSQLRAFLEEGNIINSVDYPNMDMGPVSGSGRLLALTANDPEIAAKITDILSGHSIHPVQMGQKSRGDYACVIIDTDSLPDDSTLAAVKELAGILGLRFIR